MERPPKPLCLVAELLARIGLDCMARRLGTRWACPLYILYRLGVKKPGARFWWLCGLQVRARCRPGHQGETIRR